MRHGALSGWWQLHQLDQRLLRDRTGTGRLGDVCREAAQVHGQSRSRSPRRPSTATTLVEGTDYTVAYSNNTAVGTATYAVTARATLLAPTSGSFAILPPDVVSTAITVSGASSVKRSRAYKVTGRVTPAARRDGSKLVFSRYYKGKWRQVGSAKYATLSKGAYTYTYKPSARGSWRVYATYLGNTGSDPHLQGPRRRSTRDSR